MVFLYLNLETTTIEVIMMHKQPAFKDTKKIIKKFQEICDKNKDIDLNVRLRKKIDPTSKYIEIVWTNPYKLEVDNFDEVTHAADNEIVLLYAVGNPSLTHDIYVPVNPEIKRTPKLSPHHQDVYRFMTDVTFEHEHDEYFWEEKLEKTLSVIREYLNNAKKSDNERFYDMAVAMINNDDVIACVDISLEPEMRGRYVYIDLEHYDKVSLHMADDKELVTFTQEESEMLYCLYHYNKSFQKYWQH